MQKFKIIVVGSAQAAQSVKEIVDAEKYFVAAVFNSGADMFEGIVSVLPDLVITDYELSDMTGADVAKKITGHYHIPVIVLAESDQSRALEKVKEDLLSVLCVAKPVNALVLNHVISLLLRLSAKMNDYETALETLKNKLKDRKTIDQARGLIMEKLKLSEDAAYKYIQRKAMNNGKTVVQVAKSIIELYSAVD